MDKYTLKEKASYERSAAKYKDSDPVRRFKWYGASLTDMDALDYEIMNLIPEHIRVLEVGCGDGRLAEKISQFRPDLRYCGIDIVAENIEFCKGRVPGAKFETKNYWNAINEGEFDFVISQGVLFTTTAPEYIDLLFALLNNKAKCGFFCMAISMPDLGIPKEKIEPNMINAALNSINIQKIYFKGKKEDISKVPVRLNRVFYIVREGLSKIEEVVVPGTLLNE